MAELEKDSAPLPYQRAGADAAVNDPTAFVELESAYREVVERAGNGAAAGADLRVTRPNTATLESHTTRRCSRPCSTGSTSGSETHTAEDRRAVQGLRGDLRQQLQKLLPGYQSPPLASAWPRAERWARQVPNSKAAWGHGQAPDDLVEVGLTQGTLPGK